MNEQTKALIREVARTWKEGGGDAMGFHWCVDSIRHEIMLLEQTPLENYIGSLGRRCPKCFAEQEDQDGFGVLHCAACGYCAHPSATDGKCDLCGEPQ